MSFMTIVAKVGNLRLIFELQKLDLYSSSYGLFNFWNCHSLVEFE